MRADPNQGARRGAAPRTHEQEHTMSDEQYTGPIGFAVFAVPADAALDAVAQELARLAATHGAEILDVELIARDAEAEARRLPPPDGLASSETDLLHDDDLADIAAELGAGERALVVVYEDRTLAALAARVTALGGRELLTGGIDAADIEGEEE